MSPFRPRRTVPFEQRVDTVAAPVRERGWRARYPVALTPDCFSDWFDPEIGRRSRPEWHFLHIDQTLPALAREA